jgi:hypothetical protein
MPTTKELQQLGEVAVRFGNLEFQLDGAIADVIAASDDELKGLLQALTVEMPFDRKVHAFARVVRLRFPDDANDDELKSLTAALFAAQEARDTVLHARGAHNGIGLPAPKGAAKPKRGLSWQMHTPSEEQLAEVAAAIAETSEQLRRFASRSRSARPATERPAR